MHELLDFGAWGETGGVFGLFVFFLFSFGAQVCTCFMATTKNGDCREG